MKTEIKVVESVNEISKGIMNSILPEVKSDFHKAVKKIQSQLPGLINDIVTSAPEYTDLVAGRLKLELGIPNPEIKVQGLIGLWTNNIGYKYYPPALKGNQITASFEAFMFKADFEDILGSEYAYVVDGLRGYSLPWLEWLMLNGTAPLVQGYSIVIGPNRYSRTGGAIMRAGNGSWSVPSSAAGTIDNNWITRSIASSSNRIQNLLDRTF